MFTGIIQDVGSIAALDRHGDWTVTINAHLLLGDLTLGASVACSGVCLTVIDKKTQQFTVQVSAETLEKTTAKHWAVGTRLNLERALRMGDELGGHILAGHVDGLARVMDRRGDQDSVRYQFEVPKNFTHFLAPKGSIALDGISLTVNEVEGTRFGVNIIPHTQQMTNLSDRKVGDEVNFEVDLIARYVERMMVSNLLVGIS